MRIKTDVVIVGTGVAGMFSALKLPRDKKIVIITKEDMRSSDSFLAQGGICVLRDENDYDSYFEDTKKAGHYENRKESVDIMIRGSRDIINDLVGYGVDFKMDGDDFAYTREGAHTRPRILYHEDITGKEISEKLLQQVLKLENVTILEYTTMQDILVENGKCTGQKAVSAEANRACLEAMEAGKAVKTQEEIQPGGEIPVEIYAQDTILASGGIGGRYAHSTNYPHLTGDALDIAKKHNVRLEHLDYVQIHPTTLYSKRPGRRFLISESVRGEGAFFCHIIAFFQASLINIRKMIQDRIFINIFHGKPYMVCSFFFHFFQDRICYYISWKKFIDKTLFFAVIKYCTFSSNRF